LNLRVASRLVHITEPELSLNFFSVFWVHLNDFGKICFRNVLVDDRLSLCIDRFAIDFISLLEKMRHIVEVYIVGVDAMQVVTQTNAECENIGSLHTIGYLTGFLSSIRTATSDHAIFGGCEDNLVAYAPESATNASDVFIFCELSFFLLEILWNIFTDVFCC
jgi:hypothetical protein